jgi:predicted O-linked N-acetylglucosamine transferase (SPINDLY family)
LTRCSAVGDTLQEDELFMATSDSKFQDGLALHRQGKIAEAERIFIDVLRYDPQHSLALRLLAFITLQRGEIASRRLEKELASYDEAIVRKPDDADGYVNRGHVLLNLKRYEDALASFKAAMALKPDYEFLCGDVLFTKMQICEFANMETEFARLCERIMRGEKAGRPVHIIGISSSPEVQRKAAEIWIRNRHPTHATLPFIPKRPARERIRIGYFSADFFNHAVMHLMAELIEKHDRSRFELIAFSFGPERNDKMRRRLMASFDNFMYVGNNSDKDVALLSRNLEVDMAVDLMGLHFGARTGIFALRAAPIQINYLGYSGTMGAEYIDYIIADPIVIPEESKQHYCEKIIYLPNSYQVNDTKRSISDKAFTREELGLPPTSFVFCCFNDNYKITPGVFDRWMRILKQVEGSVLWLLEDNAKAASNLRMEASTRGVDATRLIFARRIPPDEHIARYRLAHLFLDTTPCNAHTTASEALWAGLPVLTQMGETFAGRVAASLLKAIGLPELITKSQSEYEAHAIELAKSPEELSAIKDKLAKNRLTTPLFDTERYTRHLETAYQVIYERYHAELPPDHMYVEP